MGMPKQAPDGAVFKIGVLSQFFRVKSDAGGFQGVDKPNQLLGHVT